MTKKEACSAMVDIDRQLSEHPYTTEMSYDCLFRNFPEAIVMWFNQTLDAISADMEKYRDVLDDVNALSWDIAQLDDCDTWNAYNSCDDDMPQMAIIGIRIDMML